MPQHSKGARLYLRKDDGKPVWCIRDGSRRISTRCGPLDRTEAERALARYLAGKYEPPKERNRDPTAIWGADVINLYAADVGPGVRRPRELQQRLTALLGFFGKKRLSEIGPVDCRDYVAARGSESMARRELEDLRAAIRHYHKRGFLDRTIAITLPAKSEARERWLTRDEAARLIRAAWRYREVQKGVATERRSRRHVARFILVGIYTGTRSGAICGAALAPAVGRGWVDLDAGLFYRKALGDRKTKKRQPTIRIPDRLLVHMRRWREKGISTRAVIEWEGRSVASVRKAFARTVEDAQRRARAENPPAMVDFSGVSPHVLRHTAVSWAMQQGADLYKAADFFGMTVDVLERVYGHHHPDHHKGVGDALTRR
jgi:integrase